MSGSDTTVCTLFTGVPLCPSVNTSVGPFPSIPTVVITKRGMDDVCVHGTAGAAVPLGRVRVCVVSSFPPRNTSPLEISLLLAVVMVTSEERTKDVLMVECGSGFL